MEKGSGKTTLIDILIGLIFEKGSLEIDGQEINRKCKILPKQIWLYPQNFYLFDNSIRQNITISDYKESASSNEDRVILRS